MFDFSFSELLLCFVVALVVLGPERLPGVARGIGRWTGKARTYMRNLSAELERESSVAELKQQLSDARRILNEESNAMKQSFHDAAAEGRAIVGEARQQIEPASRTLEAETGPASGAAPEHAPAPADPHFHGAGKPYHDPNPYHGHEPVPAQPGERLHEPEAAPMIAPPPPEKHG